MKLLQITCSYVQSLRSCTTVLRSDCELNPSAVATHLDQITEGAAAVRQDPELLISICSSVRSRGSVERVELYRSLGDIHTRYAVGGFQGQLIRCDPFSLEITV